MSKTRIEEIKASLENLKQFENTASYYRDMKFLLQEIDRLNSKLDKAKKTIEFYGNQHLYDREKYLVLNKDLAKDDLEETGYSRFTPGKLARQTLNELEQE